MSLIIPHGFLPVLAQVRWSPLVTLSASCPCGLGWYLPGGTGWEHVSAFLSLEHMCLHLLVYLAAKIDRTLYRCHGDPRELHHSSGCPVPLLQDEEVSLVSSLQCHDPLTPALVSTVFLFMLPARSRAASLFKSHFHSS